MSRPLNVLIVHVTRFNRLMWDNGPAVTSALIPLVAVFWRLRGAGAFRVPFF